MQLTMYTLDWDETVTGCQLMNIYKRVVNSPKIWWNLLPGIASNRTICRIELTILGFEWYKYKLG